MNRFLQLLLPQYKAPTRVWLSSLGTSGVVHLLVGAAVITWLGTVATQLFPPRQGSNSIQLTASQLIEVPATETVEPETQPITVSTSITSSVVESDLEPLDRKSPLPPELSTQNVNNLVDEASTKIESIEPLRSRATMHPETAVDANPIVDRAQPSKQQPPIATSAASVTSHHDAGQLDAIPSRLYSPQPEYPSEALQLGREGRVILRIAIERDGQVSAASVIKSSGHAPLDDAARRAVLRWRFEPPKRLGVAVRTEIGVPILFQIERSY